MFQDFRSVKVEELVPELACHEEQVSTSGRARCLAKGLGMQTAYVNENLHLRQDSHALTTRQHNQP